MLLTRFRRFVATVLALAAAGWALPTSAGSQVQYQYQILHAFGAGDDGNAPEGPPVFDKKGNLYSSTYVGGANQLGTVFELTPGTNGQWSETILHSFPASPGDGYEPTGIVMDGAGNLYGTTTIGGTSGNCKVVQGCGTIFELSPGTNGQWTESILYNFCSLANCADGGVPGYAPTLGSGGALYGVASENAYQLAPGSNGWTFNVLYTFCSLPNCNDGNDPSGSLTLDARGNVYGETAEGGNGGVAYVLHPERSGQWKEFVLHGFFGGDDGFDPNGALALHGDALYGSTEAGGGNSCEGGCGTVFQLTRGSGTNINEQILHDFGPNEAQGLIPVAGVASNQRGDLFGVTTFGGSPSCECGVVYGMKPQGNGKWAYQVLYAFDVGTGGFYPDSTPTIDSQGNVYGTTSAGGQYGPGVVFELSPTAQASK